MAVGTGETDGNVYQLVTQDQGDLPIEFSDPAQQVFEFWKLLMGHARSQLGPKRSDAIRRALRMGYTADDLRLAIVGCRFSDFHQGANGNHSKYDDIELICRDETKIDRFMQMGEARVKAMIAKDAEQQAADAHKPIPMPAAVRKKLDAIFAGFKRKISL
jgi:hypothetical protein